MNEQKLDEILRTIIAQKNGLTSMQIVEDIIKSKLKIKMFYAFAEYGEENDVGNEFFDLFQKEIKEIIEVYYP